MAFLQGELISWSGLEYVFSGSSGSKQIQSIKRVISDYNEVSRIADEMISTHPGLSNVEFQPTGKVVGLQRGLRNTKPRNHIIYDDGSNKKNTFLSASNNFSSIIIYNNSNGNYASGTPEAKASYGDSAVTFKNGIAKFLVHKPKAGKKHLLALVPKSNPLQGEYSTPISASNFDYFSFVFSGPDLTNQKFTNDDSIIEIGFYINHPTSPLMFGIRNVKNQSVLAVNEFSVSGIKPKTSNNQNHPSHSAPFQTLGKNVFDGKMHRIGLWIDYSNSYCYFYINKKVYGPYTIVGSRGGAGGARAKTSTWGVYVENLEKTFMNTRGDEKSLSVFVSEMYAYDYSKLGAMQYGYSNLQPPNTTNYNFHWHNPYYLSQLVKNSPNCEPSYYFWGPLDLFGVKFYDKVAYNTSPIFTNGLSVDPDIGYSHEYTGTNGTLKAAGIKDMAISDIFSTPFRFSAMIVNNNKNNQFIWLAKSPETKGPEVVGFKLNANYLHQTNSVQIEKIINPANLQNSVTLKTEWIQSKQQAEDLLSKSVFFANSFSTNVNVQIFGNPLVQVGDICKFVYTAKRIGYDPENSSEKPIYFLVKEVGQDFTGGLTTNLSLRPLFNISSTSIA
jgi:ribosomal protein L35AE/L33A